MNLDNYDDNIIALDLAHEQLDNIPDLSKFKNLKELHLSYNKISDIISLQCLTKLKELYLNNNNISDITSLQYLINLKELWLDNNNISNITSLQYLTKLEIVYLSIKPFIVKEINPQLLINQQVDNEMIKQIYQIYTEDEIKNYYNKVKKKFKDYNFIRWY